MKKKTEYEDKGISGLGGLGSGKSDLWSEFFENLGSTDSKKSFFEKIGDSVLTSQKAKDFWNKFINNKFRKKSSIF